MLYYMRTKDIYNQSEVCSGMYVVRFMVAVAIHPESGNFLPRCGSLVDISEGIMLIAMLA
jgi:hypothetical protein